MNLRSGSITLRGRKIPIVWTGQFAEHVANNYIMEKSVHPLLHVEIQQLCQKAIFRKERGSVYTASVLQKENTFTIVGEIHLKIFYPKTCYKFK